MFNTEIYYYILDNIENIPLESVLLELELYADAVFLKHKFKDKRTVPQLVNVIKEEYQIA